MITNHGFKLTQDQKGLLLEEKSFPLINGLTSNGAAQSRILAEKTDTADLISQPWLMAAPWSVSPSLFNRLIMQTDGDTMIARMKPQMILEGPEEELIPLPPATPTPTPTPTPTSTPTPTPTPTPPATPTPTVPPATPTPTPPSTPTPPPSATPTVGP